MGSMETNTTARYKSKLTNREEIAEGTMAFHFEKPPGFQSRAGQAIDITLLNPPETDAEGNVRTFTVASPPFAEDLVIATRMRDTAFKRSLKAAPLGTDVSIEGPSGSFTLHKNSSKAAVFLAGGIGITPFMSIASQATRDTLPQELYLFYSNRRPEDTAFLDTLEAIRQQNPRFHLIATMTEMTKSHRQWKGENGFVNREMLEKYIPDLHGPIYYVAGPPGLVTAMRGILTGAGVDEDDIRTEEFAGY
jgi:ferredoxin-NADP reductase